MLDRSFLKQNAPVSSRSRVSSWTVSAVHVLVQAFPVLVMHFHKNV